MFKISPVQNSAEAKEYITLVGGEYLPQAFVYVMKDAASDVVMGASQFEISADGGIIYDLKPAPDYSNDFEALFILGRQTMNFIDICGIHTCRAAKKSAEEKLLLSIGFKKNGEEYFCDMTGFFDGNCSGHKVNLT